MQTDKEIYVFLVYHWKFGSCLEFKGYYHVPKQWDIHLSIDIKF